MTVAITTALQHEPLVEPDVVDERGLVVLDEQGAGRMLRIDEGDSVRHWEMVAGITQAAW